MLDTADEILELDVAAAPHSPPPALELVVCGRHGLRSVPLRLDGELIVGRHESCQVSLHEPTLSRYHARFVGRGTRVTVEDLGSRHGTWLAGERISSAELGLGASVRLADVVVTIALAATTHRDPSPIEPALVPEALYLCERMQAVRALLHRVAKTDLAVMVLGETGTGKELAVRELHLASHRSSGQLRVLNCAAIPPQLIESTLFGHERGAFTGADRARAGIFEEAKGGTVFLDEIGELSLAAQAALLRVLESRRLTRVGGTREIELDVRVASATHRDLPAMVARGQFRMDLLHRLYAVSVELPPLRSRREEIAPLAKHFLSQEQSAAELDPGALACLTQHDWPGNVRELRNVIARAAALAQGFVISESDLSDAVRKYRPRLFSRSAREGALAREVAAEPTLRTRMASLERTEALDALARTGGNQRQAAEQLGVPLRTFQRRLRAWRQQGIGAFGAPAHADV